MGIHSTEGAGVVSKPVSSSEGVSLLSEHHDMKLYLNQHSFFSISKETEPAYIFIQPGVFTAVHLVHM